MRLCGKKPVIERIKANPASIKKIYLPQGFDASEVVRLASSHKISVASLPQKSFQKLMPGKLTQSIIAEVDKFAYKDFDEVMGEEDKPILLFLDRIQDPHNLGAIIRTCAGLGGFCIILPKYESVEVNETVLKVACGGENYTSVCRVTNLANAIIKAKEEGYWIAATVVGEGEDLAAVKLNFPLGIIFGSEGEGVRPGLTKQADYKLTLPMEVPGFSLNVSVAVGIICYEITKHKTP